MLDKIRSIAFFLIGVAIIATAMVLGNQVMDIVGAPFPPLLDKHFAFMARGFVGAWATALVVAATVGVYIVISAIGELVVLKIKDVVEKKG